MCKKSESLLVFDDKLLSFMNNITEEFTTICSHFYNWQKKLHAYSNHANY